MCETRSRESRKSYYLSVCLINKVVFKWDQLAPQSSALVWQLSGHRWLIYHSSNQLVTKGNQRSISASLSLVNEAWKQLVMQCKKKEENIIINSSFHGTVKRISISYYWNYENGQILLWIDRFFFSLFSKVFFLFIWSSSQSSGARYSMSVRRSLTQPFTWVSVAVITRAFECPSIECVR